MSQLTPITSVISYQVGMHIQVGSNRWPITIVGQLRMVDSDTERLIMVIVAIIIVNNGINDRDYD